MIARELESGWVFTYEHMGFDQLPRKWVLGILGRAC